MKTIIAIKGLEDNGKTSSIIKIFDDLIKENTQNEILFRSEPYSNDNKDFHAVIICTFIEKKIKIGIASAGDPDSNQLDCLKKNIEHDCDIIICASRTRGETVTNVKEIAKMTNYDLIWTSNYNYAGEKDKNQELIGILNAQFSQAIIILIKAIINNQFIYITTSY